MTDDAFRPAREASTAPEPEVAALLTAFEDAAFECGEWTDAPNEESYADVSARKDEARFAIRDYIDRLRATVAALTAERDALQQQKQEG